jgi:hypothetical protein
MIMTRKRMLAAAVFTIGAFAGAAALAADVKVMLSGANEVPPVAASGSGEGTISVADDGSVSGSIMTKGVEGTMAHIHVGAAGKNGPVIVKLEKAGDTYRVPAGAKLDADQMKAFKAGDLYVNVHTPTNKGGEIRGQLK